RLAKEVHVLDHEVDPLAHQERESRGRRACHQHLRAMQRQQYLEGGAPRLAVVDDEDAAAGEAGIERAVGRSAHGRDANTRLARPAWSLYTVRVATEGDTAAARRAGCQAAS